MQLLTKLPELRYAGIPILKNPLDLFMVTELMWERRPKVFIECGTYCGASALYFAHQFDAIGEGQVISVDLGVGQWLEAQKAKLPSHPRITFMHGRSSIDPGVVSEVKALVGDRSCMVDLDSCHFPEHVLGELEAYSEIVTPRQCLVVEDSFLENGPLEAIRKFFPRAGWINMNLEEIKFGRGMTFNPEGWWLKQ